jgi:kynurenine formamidase
LEHVRYEGMPIFPALRPGFSYTLHRHHENSYRPAVDGPRSAASGLITMSDHSGTHIDALCHQSSDLLFADGTKIDQNIETPWGFTKLGAESIAPIVAKGVLIDVAAFSKDALPEEHEISVEECKFALQKEHVSIKKGDVALVRTGFGKQWSDPERYTKAAGVSKEASLWLLDMGVFAVGIDNLSWDVPKSTDPETKSKFAAHLFLLARKGVYIIENLNLEDLSSHKVYEFLFVGSPLKFKGATAGLVRPLAFSPK